MGASISKPFISDQRILSLQEKGTKLRHGDVLHVPFSSEEEYIVQRHLDSPPTSVADIIEKLYWVLPGRTTNDIERYIKGNIIRNYNNICIGKLYNMIDNQTFNETRVITYHQAPKAGGILE